MKMKKESEKAGLELNIQEAKIMAYDPITSWQIDGKTMEPVMDFIFFSSKSPWMRRADLLAKILMPEKIEAARRRGQERMRWHHQLSGHEFEQSPGDGAGRRILACGSPWGHKESGTNE